jgi:hypothetical protein
MTREQTIAMVRGYLNECGYEASVNDEGDSFQILSGSAAVYVDVFPMNEQTGVRVNAPLLHKVRDDAPLERLAQLNGQVAFAKFAFYEGDRRVVVEYDLMGWTLDRDEICGAVSIVADIADEWDEKLQEDFGGDLHLKKPDPEADPNAVDV